MNGMTMILEQILGHSLCSFNMSTRIGNTINKDIAIEATMRLFSQTY